MISLQVNNHFIAHNILHSKEVQVGIHCSFTQVSTSVVEPYNSLLSTHFLLEHTDVSELLKLEKKKLKNEDCRCKVKEDCSYEVEVEDCSCEVQVLRLLQSYT